MSNLKENLSEALRLLGSDPSAYSFDDRSSIVLQFNDVGEVIIDPDEGGWIWLWGSLAVSDAQGLAHQASQVLSHVMQPANYFAAGAWTLVNGQDVVFAGGLLTQRCVEMPMELAAALEGFHGRLGELQGLIR